MRSFVRLMAVAGVGVLVTVLATSSSLAANVRTGSEVGMRFFEGTKACSDPTGPPPHFCVMTNSNGAFLQGARVDYISEPLVFSSPGSGRVDSTVVLTTAPTSGIKPSTANGHCTFYFDTGTGVCTYAGGTRKLSGFQAVFVIGLNPDGSCCSVIGKYRLDDGD